MDDPHEADALSAAGLGNLLRPLLPRRDDTWLDAIRAAAGREPDEATLAAYFDPVLDWMRRERASRARTGSRPST